MFPRSVKLRLSCTKPCCELSASGQRTRFQLRNTHDVLKAVRSQSVVDFGEVCIPVHFSSVTQEYVISSRGNVRQTCKLPCVAAVLMASGLQVMVVRGILGANSGTTT